MKIMAVSDKVLNNLYCSDVRQKHPNVDLIVGCGDLPFYYLDFLTSGLDARIFYVRGNHDKGPQYTVHGRVLQQVDGGIDLHGRTAQHNNLLFAGLEGSMRYRPDAPFMYTDTEMRYAVAQLLPSLLYNRIKYGRFLDILVTHSPPFGIHDKTDLPHTGFRVFLPLMRYFKPRFMLHGHIHLYQHNAKRVTQFEQTTIINVYPYYVLNV